MAIVYRVLLTLTITCILLVSKVCCFLPGRLPFFKSSFASTKMGLGASILPKVEDRPQAGSKNSKKNAPKKRGEWRKVQEEFAKLCLDEGFVPPNLPPTTFEGAKLYPGTSDQPALMPGTHKHLGGAYDPTDGCIYGVPANAKSVMCLYPTKDQSSYKITSIPLPERIAKCQMKWLRGIFAHGYLWAIPSWADAVLCVDVDAYWGRRPADGDIVKLLPLPEEHPKGMQWQWHGAGINHEKTAMYCIPSNARSVLKVDAITKETSLIPIEFDPAKYPNFSLESNNKWYGGIVGQDNCVYGIPYRSCAVLKIDCTNNRAMLIGADHGCGQYNWHGGIQSPTTGKIYAHPSHADTVLVIDTLRSLADANDNDICSELAIERASYDVDERKNYKWLGGNIGADGNIYCPACDTSAVLKIDTTTDQCTTFGFAGTSKNKWQGGILGRDGCVYCIPASGTQVLRIYTCPMTDGGEPPVQLLGDLPLHKDKWQGGHVGKDGALYFIPENGYRVMKLTPPNSPPTLVNGKLPQGDVKIEML